MEEKLMTVKDLAKRWSLTEGSIYNKISNGSLKAVKLPHNRKVFFSVKYIEDIENETLRQLED